VGHRALTQFVQVDSLLQSGERLFPVVAPGFAHVGAELPDPLVLETKNVDDVGRDYDLESWHGEPLA
jgi:hypothetical protein